MRMGTKGQVFVEQDRTLYLETSLRSVVDGTVSGLNQTVGESVSRP